MTEDKRDRRRDSISMVGRYARIRVIAAVIVFLIALVALAVRALGG